MIVTVKSKDNYKVDVTRLYIQALEKSISVEDYKKEFSEIFKDSNIPKDPTIYINISSKNKNYINK